MTKEEAITVATKFCFDAKVPRDIVENQALVLAALLLHCYLAGRLEAQEVSTP